MIVQLSSGQGPSECELAVLKLYEALKKEYPDIEFLSAHEAREKRVLHVYYIYHRTGSVRFGRKHSMDM